MDFINAKSFLIGWLICGAITVALLISRHWTTIAPWATEPIYGSERAGRWIMRHKVLLLIAFVTGPIGLAVMALLGLIESVIVRIGNHGGFQ